MIARNQIPALDTDKLTAIFNAINTPGVRRLLDDLLKAQKRLEDAGAKLADAETKLSAGVPPVLAALFKPSTLSQNPMKGSAGRRGDLLNPDIEQLIEILKSLPEKTLDIRRDGYDTREIWLLAEANPQLFRYEKSAWPKVTYLD